MPEQRTVLSREVWWKHPPVVGQDPAMIAWGRLEIYSDYTSRFFEERPSEEAIATRKNCRPARAKSQDG